jgi:hypothetical protein
LYNACGIGILIEHGFQCAGEGEVLAVQGYLVPVPNATAE